MFVERSILKEFTEHLVEVTKQLKVGDPFNVETKVGAIINEKHGSKVMDFIDLAKREVY